ncbi:MAG TPA: DUF5107 domain-containing protein [Candidatus Ornithomonoglobus intestinigallinarum]|uniref:DUF5107 domain-containing protein n=1 Tax=Candidatus Ornithomonoglobus intestinigallinarum TaxID=2840894 RepID=A0A9D1KR60_9FIRM|nr:DUF5107 domain-containing protein [Candidatus Ornithomonoglobus intestinigallinarum]
MNGVIVREEKVIIPTYEAGEYDKNPMFLEKRVYQGSSGRVYPHPVCESVADEKTDKEYNAIFLENEYILVMILPEIGGRIQRLYDKTNGCDAVYYNEVIKPALVGLAGPWISGGIEFNWPQHHRPSTFDPVDYKIIKNKDGSVTVWVGETEKMFHTKGMAGFTVYPGKAYLEIKGQVYNPTDRPQTFLWWANPAVPVNDNTQSVFPPDVHAVMDHGKRAVSKFPIADGVYYKYDYAPGTDISRYKNIPVPTSYMVYHSDYNFVGNYDYKKAAGLLHIADHHISPGKKQWTWGNGDFGKAWDRNLTDENGPYIELMTGVFTDNQPDFTFLKPYEEKTFVQYFMPYKAAGAVKNASLDAALNLEPIKGDTKARLTVYTPSGLENAEVSVLHGEKTIYKGTLNLKPADVFEETIDTGDTNSGELSVRITRDTKTVLSYTPQKDTEPVPSPAEEIPEPEKIETAEKLFLAAVHLEQYRHATYSPEPYYLEGLKRDASDIRLNNGYGKYLYNKGRFSESEKYFRRAVKSSTWKNPNPYDCEPYYNLGLALQAQNKTDEAFDAFYKAVWDGNMQDKAFYRLACLASRTDKSAALEFAEKSLVRNAHNIKARTLKTALLRKLGREDEAKAFAKETLIIDPLCHGAYYELYKLTGDGLDELRAVMRGDNHNYIELAGCYAEAYMHGDAAEVLRLAQNDDDPMLHYWLFAETADKAELDRAEKSSSLYCFPNRLEDIGVLELAIENGGEYAKYYLGCLLYDKGRWEEAMALWESCAEKISLATVYRNLSLACYNKLKDGERALNALEKAFAKDKTDARVFFELDQLYKTLNFPLKKRLDNMNAHAELLEMRDDLYTEYITLLNLNGEYKNAYERIMSHQFHPWEGGEGKIPAQYRISLMGLAEEKAGNGDKEGAVRLLEDALVYPHNLGEGKLIGNMDNDIYYMLGCLYDDAKKSEEAFKLASRGEFELSSAMYYNDQPPQLMYYAAKAIEKLGDAETAEKRFEAFVKYGEEHKSDEVKIDYFAVSLPDFLIFEGDLNKKNRVHCCLMASLGSLGLNDIEKAKEYAYRGLEEDCVNAELLKITRL